MNYSEVYKTINRHPGITISEMKKNFPGLHIPDDTKDVSLLLANLTSNGYLVYIDDKNGLYPYKKVDRGWYASIIYSGRHKHEECTEYDVENMCRKWCQSHYGIMPNWTEMQSLYREHGFYIDQRWTIDVIFMGDPRDIAERIGTVTICNGSVTIPVVYTPTQRKSAITMKAKSVARDFIQKYKAGKIAKSESCVIINKGI